MQRASAERREGVKSALDSSAREEEVSF